MPNSCFKKVRLKQGGPSIRWTETVASGGRWAGGTHPPPSTRSPPLLPPLDWKKKRGAEDKEWWKAEEFGWLECLLHSSLPFPTQGVGGAAATHHQVGGAAFGRALQMPGGLGPALG